MAVSLRLQRRGRTNRAFFRLHAVDSRAPSNGASIEQLGFYDPLGKTPEARLGINRERVEYWLARGAVPSETVASILKKQGIRKPAAKPQV